MAVGMSREEWVEYRAWKDEMKRCEKMSYRIKKHILNAICGIYDAAFGSVVWG